jgi:SAM-dependent methyltransferase
MTAIRDALDRTRAHYELYPFVQGGDRRVRHWQRRLRPFLPDHCVEGAVLLDVGCGSGEITRGLVERGARVIALDLTTAATSRTRAVNPQALVCKGDALALPLPDNAVDHSVSVGVLHHTPDCFAALAELARVTRPGGLIVVMLYARWTPYHAIYSATAVLRKRVPVTVLERWPHWIWGLARIVVAAQVGQRLPDRQLKALVADQIWNPTVGFHSARAIRQRSRELDLVTRRRHALFLHANLIQLSKAVPS